MWPELQRDLARYLLEGDSATVSAAIEADGLTPQARLQVYRNHVMLSLRTALATTFPVVRRLVGEDFFAHLVRAFVIRHPPASSCLSDFGGALAGFIECFAPSAPLPYLADVARLEWALNQAWHSPVETALDPAALSAVDPDRLAASSLSLQPSIQLVVSAWPLEAIWRANQPERDGTGVDLAAGGCALLVWREGDDAVFHTLPAEEAGVLRSLMAGQPLQAAFAQSAAPDTLSFLLANGLATACESPAGS